MLKWTLGPGLRRVMSGGYGKEEMSMRFEDGKSVDLKLIIKKNHRSRDWIRIE
jgi:hypothetical protein